MGIGIPRHSEEADGLHFNPRVTLIPPIELQKMICPWLDIAFKSFKSDLLSDERATARHFLEYMLRLRIIILQDAAAILSTDPPRHSHPIFQFDVFNNSMFQTYYNSMKKLLLESESPVNSSLETVIPGMNTRLTGIQVGVDNHGASIVELQRCLAAGFANTPQQIETSIKSMMTRFLLVASNHFLQAEDYNDDNNDATISPPSTSIIQVHTSDQDIYNNNKQALPPGFNYRLT